MLRRIGTCRKKVMGLLRLMGNKADVVKGLAKRCNENWRVAPTSDIVRFSLSLFVKPIMSFLLTLFGWHITGTVSIGYSGINEKLFQSLLMNVNPFYSKDHLITMTQNLNHYEKILSRSHSNYLAQISIEMTEANNQINDVLSKLTALGTVLIPMNLVTGEYLFFSFFIILLYFFPHVGAVFNLFYFLFLFRFMGNERTCSRPRFYWGKVFYPLIIEDIFYLILMLLLLPLLHRTTHGSSLLFAVS